MASTKTTFQLLILCFIALVPFCLIGCGQGKLDVKAAFSNNIRKVHVCYVKYMEAHNARGPKDEAEFKKFIHNNQQLLLMLKRIDVTPENLDDIFTSERDGEPFLIRYGLKGLQTSHAIVFEKTGVDGKRFVAFGTPAELDSDEAEAYFTGEKKPESFNSKQIEE